MVKKPSQQLKLIAGLLGNILEWYDFALFGTFGDIIGDVFFPSHHKGNTAIFGSFIVFGCAFIARPVGGVIIGYIGDKYGRKVALEISIFLMAIPTFATGCIPPFSKIGWASTVLLLTVRFLQGISVGGQLMSSLLFTVESHPKSQRGFYGSFVYSTACIGSLLGTLVSSVMRDNMTYEALSSWGWRIPFQSGIIVALSAIYLKYFCEDDDERSIHRPSHDRETSNLNDLIKEIFNSSTNQRSLVSCILTPMIGMAGGYLTFVWLPIYMSSMLEHPVPHAFDMSLLSNFICGIILLPLIGMLSDKVGHNRMMMISGSALAVISPGLICLVGIGSDHLLYAFIAQTVLGVLLAMWTAPMCAWLAERFPENIRLTAVSIGYNISMATLGGFSPAIATLMVDRFGVTSPGYLYSAVAILSLIGLHMAPKNHEVDFEKAALVAIIDKHVLPPQDENEASLLELDCGVTSERDPMCKSKSKDYMSLLGSRDVKTVH